MGVVCTQRKVNSKPIASCPISKHNEEAQQTSWQNMWLNCRLQRIRHLAGSRLDSIITQWKTQRETEKESDENQTPNNKRRG